MLSTAQIDELLSITALARRTAPLVQSSIHGELHWQAVARIGLRLSAGTPGAESHLVALFAILHDCRRENDGYDPDHGRRAAQLLHQLDVAGEVTVPDAAFTKLHEALSLHNDGETSRDPTIGVCWDADRLCLPRVGIDLDDGLLSTRAGLRAREWVRPLIHAPLDGWREVLNGDRVWRWREELGTKTDAELVAALNREVGNPGWSQPEASTSMRFVPY